MSSAEPGIRFAHTNLVADDWRRMVSFYVEVFGCKPVGVERNHEGDWIEKVTGIADARIRGVHLLLPGHGDQGPTLEIFQYDSNAPRPTTSLNTPGFAHLAFEVRDVEMARQQVLAHGGSELGERHTATVKGEGCITLIYMRDPEGNVVELQNWERE